MPKMSKKKFNETVDSLHKGIEKTVQGDFARFLQEETSRLASESHRMKLENKRLSILIIETQIAYRELAVYVRDVNGWD